jgi:hypothetical protein
MQKWFQVILLNNTCNIRKADAILTNVLQNIQKQNIQVWQMKL